LLKARTFANNKGGLGLDVLSEPYPLIDLSTIQVYIKEIINNSRVRITSLYILTNIFPGRIGKKGRL